METILDHVLFKHKKFAELVDRTEKQQILNACIRLLEFEAEIILHGIIIDLNETGKITISNAPHQLRRPIRESLMR